MSKLKRIMALLGAISLILMLVCTFVLALMGSRYFMVSLVFTIFLPIFIYGCIVVYRAFRK